MAPWKSRARAVRLPFAVTPGRTVALAAVLAAVAAAAGCSPAPAGPSASAASAQRTVSPAVTAPAARKVFDFYVAAADKAAAPKSASSLLSLATGVEHAVLAATLARHSVVEVNGDASSASAGTGGAYRSTRTVRPGFHVYTYGSPTFYLPEAAGYPHFFVASVTRTLRGTAAGAGTVTKVGDAQLPQDGPVLMLFSQARKGASWLLASISRLPAGMTVPPLAKDASGYIPAVTPSAVALLARPAYVGPLQAAVVDDGPSSAAAEAVAAGPLTTGMYQGAVNHADGMTTPPRGDVYQWELDGASYPEFGLRTANGGALVFYAMTLNTTVAVPDVIDKASPIHPGPPIQVPLDLRMLLPENQPAPLVQLQSRQTLSFTAIDPPHSPAKIRVVAIGGGLTSASAS